MVRKAMAAVLLCSTAGCSSVRPLTAPSSFIQQHRPDEVWVADTNGEVIRLAGPTVRGDSLVGLVDGASQPVAVRLTPEQEVFARQKSPRRTAELVGLFGVVGGFAIWGFLVGGDGPDTCPTPGFRGCPG